ncbi:MAG: pyridoxal-dependent decarboxylase [Salinibacter sp.]|uniref:pyridoxal phosphate-dependent decarboxylase family protein n=1 Tax=Salinibacter sp. TaxID=2065818 RepID=UPI002FC29DEF
MSDAPSSDTLHKAAFLGPKGENADELERLLLEVLRDHVFWRRNFHPRDPRLIDERDKRTEAFDDMSARLRDELSKILAELKRAAPLYSPRQVAHIVSDPSLPAFVGYFAGLLYNQNNVVAEVSPETVREERAYFKALAEMVGYPTFLPETLPRDARTRRSAYSWGHLCSGGTVANLEALWIARNIRLYPLAVRLVAHQTDAFASFADLEVTTATGERAALGALSTWRLSNLPIDAITDLHLRIKATLGDGTPERAQAFQEALPSVRRAGLASFLLQYNRAFPDDPARLPKVFISQATHYCWQKNMDVVGLGADALETIPVDARIRLDTDALRERLHTCIENRQPVLGVVSIVGTTEEGAIDPLHEIEAVRSEVADAGLTFWHHCDAAFGGFFASLLPKTDAGDFVPPAQLDDGLVGADGLLRPDNAEALTALPETDSLTIDPHKFGYVPYPAGAVLFRDYHVRDAIAYKAPYLAEEDQSGFGGFLGQWTLEGSRPGAVAVSCYLSQAMVPLTPDGHGRFMKNCLRANQQLFAALTERFSAAGGELDLRPFHHPETVAFCFVVAPEQGVESVAALNDYTNRIWQQMTVDGREDINQYAFLLSQTEVGVADYAHILEDLLPTDVVREAAESDEALTLLRTCLMNPFQSDWNTDDGAFAEQVADFLYDVALEEYVAHTFPPVPRPDADRHPILVVEQTPRAQEGLARYLEHDEKVIAHFDVRSCSAATLKDLRGRLGKVRDLVLHVDPSAPSQALRIARWLVEEADIDPAHLLAVATEPTDGTEVHTRLLNVGVPARNILLESDLRTSARRLVLKLSARRPGPTVASS